jgi:hypothetical protein
MAAARRWWAGAMLRHLGAYTTLAGGDGMCPPDAVLAVRGMDPAGGPIHLGLAG